MSNEDTCIFLSTINGSLAVRVNHSRKATNFASKHRQEILVIPPIAYRTRTAPRCGCDRIERSAGQIDFAAFVLTSQVKAKETQYFVELFDAAISQTFLSRWS
jgi:hypothetical protein